MRRYSWIFGLEDVRSIVLDAEDVQRLRQENSALRRHTSGLFILERVLHPGISEEGIYDITCLHIYIHIYMYMNILWCRNWCRNLILLPGCSMIA